jgi:hypothetical protein
MVFGITDTRPICFRGSLTSLDPVGVAVAPVAAAQAEAAAQRGEEPAGAGAVAAYEHFPIGTTLRYVT